MRVRRLLSQPAVVFVRWIDEHEKSASSLKTPWSNYMKSLKFTSLCFVFLIGCSDSNTSAAPTDMGTDSSIGADQDGMPVQDMNTEDMQREDMTVQDMSEDDMSVGDMSADQAADMTPEDMPADQATDMTPEDMPSDQAVDMSEDMADPFEGRPIGQCVASSDCPSNPNGAFCNRTLPGGSCGGCGIDSHCDDECFNGVCVTTCQSNSDCPPGLSCTGAGRCGAMMCVNGQCPDSLFGCSASNRCERIDCSDDAGVCPNGTTCTSGLCVEDRALN